MASRGLTGCTKGYTLLLFVAAFVLALLSAASAQAVVAARPRDARSDDDGARGNVFVGQRKSVVRAAKRSLLDSPPVLPSFPQSSLPQSVNEVTMKNEWGPYVASYVVVRNMRRLPGNNYVWYPSDPAPGRSNEQPNLPIAEGSRRFPVAVYSYGYNANCVRKPAVGGSLHMRFMAYLASWGIVTGCPTDVTSDGWNGQVLQYLMDGMEAMNADASSMFSGRLKVERFATIGRSYGGNRAINAAARERSRVAAVITDAQCTAAWCTATMDAQVAAPVLYMTGTYDDYYYGISSGFSRVRTPKMFLVAQGETHDSAPMQVWRSFVVLFILLNVDGQSELASTVWGNDFFNTPVQDDEWGTIRMSTSSSRRNTQSGSWPMCAATGDDLDDVPRYTLCPPVACPAGASSAREKSSQSMKSIAARKLVSKTDDTALVTLFSSLAGVEIGADYSANVVAKVCDFADTMGIDGACELSMATYGELALGADARALFDEVSAGIDIDNDRMLSEAEVTAALDAVAGAISSRRSALRKSSSTSMTTELSDVDVCYLYEAGGGGGIDVDACFPFDAVSSVMMGSGVTVQRDMGSLRVGDRVAVLGDDGAVKYEPILTFTHREDGSFEYVSIVASSTAQSDDDSTQLTSRLRLSADHLVPVMSRTYMHAGAEMSSAYMYSSGARTQTRAADVKVGDVMWLHSSADGVVAPAVVREVSRVKNQRGAVHPRTLSGTIIVGDAGAPAGLVASCDTSRWIGFVPPALSRALLLPLSLLARFW